MVYLFGLLWSMEDSMKKQLSPAVMIGIIVLVVAIIGGIGYKYFAPPKLKDATDLDERKKYFPNGYPFDKNEVTKPAAGTASGTAPASGN